MTNIIRVSAVLVHDAENRALMVRKHNTTAFMQPGGKPEPGETPVETAARELAEELGIDVPLAQYRELGQFRTPAANESGFDVVADCFQLLLTDTDVVPAAEIAEARWLRAADLQSLDVAPLSRTALLPLLWGEAPHA